MFQSRIRDAWERAQAAIAFPDRLGMFQSRIRDAWERAGAEFMFPREPNPWFQSRIRDAWERAVPLFEPIRWFVVRFNPAFGMPGSAPISITVWPGDDTEFQSRIRDAWERARWEWNPEKPGPEFQSRIRDAWERAFVCNPAQISC